MTNQRTLAGSVTCRGVGLHTGHETVMTFQPAPPNTGLRFRRVDLPGQPEIPADVDAVQSTDRGTTLGVGEAQVHTVEHVLAALYAFGIDNCYIDVDAPEPPVHDGSAQEFTRVLQGVGATTQAARRHEFVVTEPIAMSHGDVSVTAIPANELRLSYTIEYGHPALGAQFRSLVIGPDSFATEVAAARTFCFLHDVEALKATGLIRGGSLDNAVVIGDEAILNEDLRFPDEFVRHKLLDLLGDLALFGPRLRGHIIATKAGHQAHVAFLRHLRARTGVRPGNGRVELTVPKPDALRPAIGIAAAQAFLPFDRETVTRVLPHRDPFLFVDTVTELREDFVAGTYRLRPDDWFFRGHFPGMPVTPGVIMVEALAQVGGVLTRILLPDPQSIPVLLTLEDVKFRKAVRPGDTLRLEVTPLRMKTKIGKLRGTAYVDGDVACECRVVFTMLSADRVRDSVGLGV